MHRKTANALIYETSPYLLQHAHNPVDWQPWSKELLDKAKRENKLLIISIGYSTCHWCHVMEHESFEDATVAELMNSHYLSVKVDREERPDIDRHYMDAVQLMSGRGGWPLNVVTLPDGRPVWGGTYFKKEQWMQALVQIQELFQNQPGTLYTYATQLEKGLRAVHVVDVNTAPSAIDDFDINAMLQQWTPAFDMEKGGLKGAPKFMMAGHLAFLLQESVYSNNEQLRQYVMTTLTQMAYGGIFDHVNGGFSRYSVDERWHVPHFEKMLYDNAQLVSLYCDAYLVSKKLLFKEVVFETLQFVEKELTSKEGVFYTALDADSLDSYGVLKEGAYYSFTKEKLQEIVGNDFELFSTYYNINDYGKWEGEYVLIRTKPETEIARQFSIDTTVLQHKKQLWKKKLRKHREDKTRPRLDNKVLTSWNALIIKAYVDAYRVFGERKFLDTALKAAHFIKDNQWQRDGTLFRGFTNGKQGIQGCLDDYVFLAEAYITLYETTFDESWLTLSQQLTAHTLEHFYDADSGMFFYTSDQSEQLLNRTVEYRDNVMPASNSVQAHNLFRLSHFFSGDKYKKTARKMLANVLDEAQKYPLGFSNWLSLWSYFKRPFYEIAISGKEVERMAREIEGFYIPSKIIMGAATESTIVPLLKNRYVKNKTLAYICKNKVCLMPTEDISKIIKIINKKQEWKT